MIFDSRFINHIIDSMADDVFTLDNNGKITSWNHSMTRITGYSPDEVRRLGVSHTAIWKYMKKWKIPLKFDDMKQV